QPREVRPHQVLHRHRRQRVEGRGDGAGGRKREWSSKGGGGAQPCPHPTVPRYGTHLREPLKRQATKRPGSPGRSCSTSITKGRQRSRSCGHNGKVALHLRLVHAVQRQHHEDPPESQRPEGGGHARRAATWRGDSTHQRSVQRADQPDGAGDLQAVEDGDEDVSGDEQPEEIGAAQEPVLGAEAIDLGRDAQDGHGRLEGGQQGQGDGLDLSNCSLQSLPSAFNEAAAAVVLDLTENPLPAIPDGSFSGFTRLQQLAVPLAVPCPGGSGAWEEVTTYGSSRLCHNQRNPCNGSEELAVPLCPENAACAPDGPGMSQCLCASPSHGYKCLRQGAFPVPLFCSVLGAVTAALSIALWGTQRRHAAGP
uniref:All-trans retinoic acid induced differentiation factor n=1 Tax=Gallus gallus TaxID=9031 RepID=A0A8V0Y2S5_CHICK